MPALDRNTHIFLVKVKIHPRVIILLVLGGTKETVNYVCAGVSPAPSGMSISGITIPRGKRTKVRCVTSLMFARRIT